MVVLHILLSMILVLLVVYYLHFRWRYRHVLSAASKLPCPPAWPIIGNALSFLGGITSVTNIVVKFTKELKGLFCIWIGPVPLFVVSNPSDVQIILNNSNTLEKDDIYHFLKPFMGNGLLTAPVHTWKKYRRMVSPVLFPSNVDKFLPVFHEVSNTLVQELSKKAIPLDPRDLIFDAAMDAIARTAMSRSPVDMKMKADILFLLDKAGRMFTYRLFKVWLHIDWIFHLFYKREMDQALKTMASILDVIDQNWREEEEKRKNNTSQEKNGSKSESLSGYSLADVVFTHPEEASEHHDWRNEVTTMVVGATDTVVAALSFLLVTIADKPEIQDKIYTEIKEVTRNGGGEITAADLNSMKYLDQAIMESMRLHGTFPVILRKATRDTKLSGCTLPAGSRVLVPLHAMGWNSDQFPDPEIFLPERFSPEAFRDGGNQRHKYAFLPFSGGPRNCIGKYYAMLIMKTVMVHVLREFHVTTEVKMSDIEYELKVVMFSKTPLLIKFEPR